MAVLIAMKIMRNSVAGAGMLALATTSAVSAAETTGEETLRLRIIETSIATDGDFGESAQRYAIHVATLSAGTIEIIVERAQNAETGRTCAQDATAGEHDGCWSEPAVNEHLFGPAVHLWGGAPFSPSLDGWLAWKLEAGANRMRDALYANIGFVAIDAACLPASSGAWSEEGKGLETAIRNRIVGAPAHIHETLIELGAKPTTIEPGDAAQAITLEGADTVLGPSAAQAINEGLAGQIANSHWPGWHRPIRCAELVLTKRVANALEPTARAILEAAATLTLVETYAEALYSDLIAMRSIDENAQTSLVRWSDEEVDEARRAWKRAAQKVSEQDKSFDVTLGRWKEFQSLYSRWQTLTRIKAGPTQ